ncbi:MAG: hypothetical protein ACLGIZ_05050 [Acidimicrobiia bacterium]
MERAGHRARPVGHSHRLRRPPSRHGRRRRLALAAHGRARPRRIQVLDEAWALLGNRHTARYLQSCFKLGRTYGVANICIAHRPSDLGAQADDGTSTAKIAGGLLADAATKILLRQAPDQLESTTTSFGLTDPERQIVGQLTRGRALWKVAGRTAVVHHMLGRTDAALCDTDARMAGDPSPQPVAA